ncbi:uncharacterized protein LOC117172007 [Belonocnema kinseyi]|uniref:uncharacterized protein LOC117172007 n=1 Tax=Belonocnema kinseyi TaxID=2817044 RepID=UPI00143D6E37|nr:uncharacterized protein LOC117172007 [Belonocnema kinseyi]
METLEKSRVCRLCGKHSGISIDIFDKNESHVKKINAILPVLVHEMDLLPKQMCHRCSYKLEEFHKFYIDCLKTDAALKNQLSWMRKDNQKERIGVPMVHIENVKIKTEPHEIDPLLETVSLVEFPVSGVQTGLPDCIMYTSFANSSRCQCYCDKADPTRQVISKDCAHPQLDLRKSTDLTTYHRLNGISEQHPDPEILWKKRKNLFGLTADPPKSTNQEKPSAAPAFAENGTLPKAETVPRTLRPRKRSVDYVGTKRKATATDAENGMKSVEIGGELIVIKDEPLETGEEEGVEPLRTLRPRKNAEGEEATEENRSKSAERCRKRVKTSSVKPRRSNSLAQEVLVREIKQEILDITDDGEELILRLKTEPRDLDSPSVTSPRKRKEAPKVAQEVPPKEVKLGPRINKDELLVKAIDICKEGLGFSKVGGKTGGGLVGKEEFKVGRVLVKRSSKVCFSPKNLRSQDLHLRSGKVKVKDALKPPQFRRDFKKNHEKLAESAKMKVLKLANVDLKQLCEKCNISFANKELFRLHACYSN